MNDPTESSATSSGSYGRYAVLLATALAAGAAAGWFLHIRVLVQIVSGPAAMVLSTAAGCLIAGLSLLLIYRAEKPRRDRIARIGGALLLLLGLLGVAGNLWHTDLGLDFPALHQGLVPGYGPAGRMGTNTGLVLAVLGVNLLGYGFRQRLSRLWMARVSAVRYLLIVVFLQALANILTHWLDLSDLFTWYYTAGFNRMSPLTAVTVLLLGIALWQLWEDALVGKWPAEELEGMRILRTAAFTLTITAVATGLAGIILLQNRLMEATQENMQRMAADYANSIDTQLAQRVDRASILSNQQEISSALRSFSRNPADADAVKILRESAEALLQHGFSSVEFHGIGPGSDPVSEPVRAGERVDDAVAAVPIQMAYPAKLLWKKGYLLETRVPVEGNAGPVGYIVSQQPLTGLNRLMARADQAGRSGELSLCARWQGGILCFPHPSHPTLFLVPRSGFEDHQPLLASLGRRGSTVTEVNGQRVLAAYGPVGSSQLGLEVQADTAEILRPARRGLEVAAPLILLLIGAGYWGLNLRIRPLIQKLISSREHIRRLATHDALTDLPNRLLLEDRCATALRLAVRHNEQVGLMMVDLDRFKAINDEMGHAAGDQVLVEVAARLKACIRDSDTVARFGGDEFVLLLPGVRHPEATTVIVSKIIEVLNRPLQLGMRTVTITSSVGIAVYPDNGADLHSLLQHADSAMYGAKSAGRNGFRISSAESESALGAVARLAVER